MSKETDLGGSRVNLDSGADSSVDSSVELDEEDLDDVDILDDPTEIDIDDTPHPADRRGMSGDAGGIFPRRETDIPVMYSGAGSGMDDETANTTSRSGRGGGAGYSTYRATMGDDDGATSFGATRADAGGQDSDEYDEAIVDERNEVDTAMADGSGYATIGRNVGAGMGGDSGDIEPGDLRDDAVGYSGSTSGISDDIAIDGLVVDQGERNDRGSGTGYGRGRSGEAGERGVSSGSRDEAGIEADYNTGVGTGASGVGASAGGMTDDDIRSDDDKRITRAGSQSSGKRKSGRSGSKSRSRTKSK